MKSENECAAGQKFSNLEFQNGHGQRIEQPPTMKCKITPPNRKPLACESP